MSNKQVVKPIALAVGIALAGPFAAVEAASDDTVASPFGMTMLSAPYMLGESEGKCGGEKAEGSCGGDKAEGDDKGGEGKCGGSI